MIAAGIVKAARLEENVYKIHRARFVLSSVFATLTDRNGIMNFLNLISGLIFGVYLVNGASRYIAIPIDEIDVIEVNPIVSHSSRYPRQTENYVPALVSGVRQDDHENLSPRNARSDSHILDYVDFGAHTGNNGAYSWYADFPAQH